MVGDVPEFEPLRLLTGLVAPGTVIAGRDFLSALPADLSVLAPEERRSVFAAAQREASDVAVAAALVDVGNVHAPVPSSPEGFRMWPEGLVGSVTHKGTSVLVAISPNSTHLGIGIDLEIDDGSDLSVVPGLASSEELPGFAATTSQALHLVFSAKEAVFKAVYPRRRLPLAFDDVRVRWSGRDDGHGLALVGDDALEVRVVASRWVVALAMWRAAGAVR